MNIYYKTFKEFIKKGYKIFFIFLSDEMLNNGINVITKYTNRFIVLNNINYEPEKMEPHISLNCKNIDNINTKIDSIFNGENSFCSETIDSSLNNAIVFIKSNSEDYMVKLYEMLYLFDFLPDNYYIDKISFNNENNVIMYFTNIPYKKEFKPSKKPIAVFIGNGIGDLCIMGSALIEFLNAYNEVYLFIPDHCKVSELLSSALLSNCKIFKIGDIKILEKIFPYFELSGQFKECFDLFFLEYKFQNEYLHYYDLFLRQTNLDINLSPYKHDKLLQKTFMQNVSAREKEWVDKRIDSSKKNIGLQFWTNEPMSVRCWDEINVKKFCQIHNINNNIIFNLTPYPRDIYTDIQVYDASHLSIFGVMYLISKLNCVVGIDSCCGHIASLFNIPSITLWNEQTPVELVREKIKIGFRALRNNYSIVPINSAINSIKADCVINILNDILNEKIILNKKYISIQDSLEGKNILYI